MDNIPYGLQLPEGLSILSIPGKKITSNKTEDGIALLVKCDRQNLIGLYVKYVNREIKKIHCTHYGSKEEGKCGSNGGNCPFQDTNLITSEVLEIIHSPPQSY